jgi:hypothetical protein
MPASASSASAAICAEPLATMIEKARFARAFFYLHFDRAESDGHLP